MPYRLVSSLYQFDSLAAHSDNQHITETLNTFTSNLDVVCTKALEAWRDIQMLDVVAKSIRAVGYTYALAPRLGRYVNDGRYNIDNNGAENAIRPLGRKNYLFCGNNDAAVRAAVVYSLFSSCKALGIDERTWLEDVLVRVKKGKDGKISNTPEELKALLPANWQPLAVNSK